MQLDARRGSETQTLADGVEKSAEKAMQRNGMLAIKLQVQHACQQALHLERAADEFAHQVAHRVEVSQRNQRTVVMVGKCRQRLPLQSHGERAVQKNRLLIGGLRARRHRFPLFRPWTTGAIAESKNIRIN